MFVKGKWRFAFDCRSLQIRWFLSDYTVLAVRRQSPCLLVMTSLDDRMASAGWQVGDGEIGYNHTGVLGCACRLCCWSESSLLSTLKTGIGWVFRSCR